ncbi:MAG: alpha/beta hydrolase [Solirubrobacteraceae bacterium]|nr:alpha/beta hydrolase [Solirubrobacteraceae bacterium]
MARYLLLHGFGGVGADHWLVWLSTELRQRGHVARIRKLPSPAAPELDAWMAAMRARLDVLGGAAAPLDEAGDASGELVVVAHSLGARLWLQHTQEFGRGGPHPVADRVALVAPPRLPEGIPATRFHDLDFERVRPELAARETRLVVSGNDPYWPQGGAAGGVGDALGIPVDHVGDHGHLEPADGYGPWPSMLAWCLGDADAIGA